MNEGSYWCWNVLVPCSHQQHLLHPITNKLTHWTVYEMTMNEAFCWTPNKRESYQSKATIPIALWCRCIDQWEDQEEKKVLKRKNDL